MQRPVLQLHGHVDVHIYRVTWIHKSAQDLHVTSECKHVCTDISGHLHGLLGWIWITRAQVGGYLDECRSPAWGWTGNTPWDDPRDGGGMVGFISWSLSWMEVMNT